jgi:DNA-binding XRE family transcriptional regulator
MTNTAPFKLVVTLKTYLDDVGVTAYTLGKWVEGVSPQTIYAVANGTRKPSLDVLEAIISAFRANGFATQLSDLVRLENTVLDNVS